MSKVNSNGFACCIFFLLIELSTIASYRGFISEKKKIYIFFIKIRIDESNVRNSIVFSVQHWNSVFTSCAASVGGNLCTVIKMLQGLQGIWVSIFFFPFSFADGARIGAPTTLSCAPELSRMCLDKRLLDSMMFLTSE